MKMKWHNIPLACAAALALSACVDVNVSVAVEMPKISPFSMDRKPIRPQPQPTLNEKNIINAEYTSLPADYWKLLSDHPEKWNFNFRPYASESAEMLWSDSTLQRNVVVGSNLNGKCPTALYVSFDDDAITLLLFAGEPGMKDSLEKGQRRPDSCFECFFQPGDADSFQFQHYYQFTCTATEPRTPGVYPWLMEDSSFRSIAPYLSVQSHTLANGNLLKVTIPWEPLFDRLPFFGGKRDNIWRLSVIRWAPTGGQTFGGTVHQQTEAGYMRFPEFTEEMQTRIMKNLLLKGWDAYKATLAKDYLQPDILPVNHAKHYIAEAEKHLYDAYVIAEDYKFRNAVGNAMIAERDALGKTIANFESLPFAERVAFYRKASPMLYNFRYDFQKAYGEWQKNQLFSNGGK